MNYSNIICIGDSFTNEKQCYIDNGILSILNDRKYEFKSYPQVLSEIYNCPYELRGAPGRTMNFTINDLIDSIDYILSLENPLIIYQFGYFFNSTLRLDEDTHLIWKDFLFEKNTHIVINEKSKLVNGLKSEDKNSIIHWYQNFEEYRNYYYIDTFLTIKAMINRIKPIDMYGIILWDTKFKLPINKSIIDLTYLKYEGINSVFSDLDEYHKSTNDNIKLANTIKDIITNV